jgi:hypothetical protein
LSQPHDPQGRGQARRAVERLTRIQVARKHITHPRRVWDSTRHCRWHARFARQSVGNESTFARTHLTCHRQSRQPDPSLVRAAHLLARAALALARIALAIAQIEWRASSHAPP